MPIIQINFHLYKMEANKKAEERERDKREAD
jgi:hypothetical protein